MKKATQKPVAPRLSKTRKATIIKKAVALSYRHLTDPTTWRTGAKTKAEKEIQALKSHPRRERSTNPCARPSCRKMALVDHTLCAKHLDAMTHAPGRSDVNVYERGEAAYAK